jgi:hypothetical protein
MAVVALFAFSAQANAQCVIPAGTTQLATDFDPNPCGGQIIVNGTLELSPANTTVDWESYGAIELRVEGVGAFLEFVGGNVNLRLAAGSTVVLANGGRFLEDPACPASERIFIGGALWATCNGGGGAPFSFPDLNALAEELEAPGAFTASVSSGSICFENALTLSASTTVSGATLSWTGSGPGGYTFSSASANPTIAANTFTTAGTYTFVARVTNTLGFYEEQSFTVEVAAVCSVINSDSFVLLCRGESKTLIANFGEPIASYQWFKDGSPIPGAETSQFLLNRWSLGNYSVQATAVGGGSLSAGPITVNKVRVLTEAGDNAHYKKVCLNAETTYSAPYLQGASYSWNVRPSGAQVASTMEHTFTGFEGSFDVFVTSSTGCTRSTRVRVLPENEKNCEVEETPTRPTEEVSAKTTADAFGNDVALTFYPNPVRGNYKINLSGLAQDETFNVSWFDLTGKQVMATTISTGTGTVVENSVNNLSKGLYLVQVNNANHNFTFKVMVD